MRSLIEDEVRSPFEIGPDGMSIDLLRAVYRNPSLDLSVRMRAASLAIPYEMPKLAVTALVDNQRDFATILDRRIKHMNELNGVKMIEATPTRVQSPPMPIKLLRRI